MSVCLSVSRAHGNSRCSFVCHTVVVDSLSALKDHAVPFGPELLCHPIYSFLEHKPICLFVEQLFTWSLKLITEALFKERQQNCTCANVTWSSFFLFRTVSRVFMSKYLRIKKFTRSGRTTRNSKQASTTYFGSTSTVLKRVTPTSIFN